MNIAVVGAGPAGLYAVQSLLMASSKLNIDVFDRLPTPYGLVRYGISPDNQKMKSVKKVLCRSFEQGQGVNYIGNVCLGVDINRQDLLDHYDAIIYATGAQEGKRLNVPGENFDGNYEAKQFVEWYNGHPDAAVTEFGFDVNHVAVIGAGNVSLDVCRMLMHDASEIAMTDVPEHVLESYKESKISDVHLISRRGPAQVKFTPIELRKFDDLSNVDIVVDPEELILDSNEKSLVQSDQQLRTNFDMLRRWSTTPPKERLRRIHIHFFRSPVRIEGKNRVEKIMLEKNKLGIGGEIIGTHEIEKIEVEMVFSCVGHKGTPLPSVPFDESKSIIPNEKGRVLDRNGRSTKKEYVTGWAKRGAKGTVGTNKADSVETVGELLKELGDRVSNTNPEHESILRLLDKRGINYTNWEDWIHIDRYEIMLGKRHGRPRVKVPSIYEMMSISHERSVLLK